MGMKLCFCKVVFCITEFCCQSSIIFLVLLSFQSSRFFILTASILQFSVLLSFAVKAAGRFLEAESRRQNLQGGFNAFLTKGLA